MAITRSQPSAEPTPLVAPPQPMGVGVLRVQKQRYRDWVTAGGGSIYPPVTLPPKNPARAANLIGAAFTSAEQTTLLATLKALTNASLAVTVDGIVQQMAPTDIHLASDLTSIAAGIANNLPGATCAWVVDHFEITSDTTGAGSSISYAVAPAAGTNISATCRLNQGSGAAIAVGSVPFAAETEPEPQDHARTHRKRRHIQDFDEPIGEAHDA